MSKCSYCWGRLKVVDGDIELNCGHRVCKECLLLVYGRRARCCPLCEGKVSEEIFNEFLGLDFGKDMSIVPYQTHKNLKSNPLNSFKSFSKKYKTLARSFILLNNLRNLESSFTKLPNKKKLDVSEIVSSLKILKAFNIQEALSFDFSKCFNHSISKKKRRTFLKILFSKILFEQTDTDILWLGTKLRNLGDINTLITIDIKNDGDIRLKLYSIGFGIDFKAPDAFYCERIDFELNGRQFSVDGTNLQKDQTNFFFALNRLDLEIKPSQTLKIQFQVGNGYYLAVKDQQAHCFKGCPIVTSTYIGHNIIAYLRFK